MTESIQRRLAALEQSAPGSELIVRILSFVGPGEGREPVRITRLNGTSEWVRLEGESVEAFRVRASMGPHERIGANLVVLREHNEMPVPTSQEA